MSQWVDTRRLRIGMAQINTTVGDFDGNRQEILKATNEAKSLGVDLLTFPELAICGYPPEDLLFKPQFIAENLRSLEKVVDASSGLTIVVVMASWLASITRYTCPTMAYLMRTATFEPVANALSIP